MVTAVDADTADTGCVTTRYKGKVRSFKLDKVFLPQATQEEVRVSCPAHAPGAVCG